MATLYLVATPIGNLEDITLRALRVLGEVDLIAAEDTRVTRKLLSHYDIHTRTTSYHEHNRASKTPTLLAALAEGKDVALVTDAGTPAVSDPGDDLVRAALDQGLRVASVPGPSAVTAALAVSGMLVDQFVYLGFLPRRGADRRRLLRSLADEERAIVLLETPHRLRAGLTDALEALGDRPVSVCRELTKLYEEVFGGLLSEALDHFDQPRGEFTVVIGGGHRGRQIKSLDQARSLIEESRAKGVGATESVRLVVRETGLPRAEVYRLWVEGGSQQAP